MSAQQDEVLCPHGWRAYRVQVSDHDNAGGIGTATGTLPYADLRPHTAVFVALVDGCWQAAD